MAKRSQSTHAKLILIPIFYEKLADKEIHVYAIPTGGSTEGKCCHLRDRNNNDTAETAVIGMSFAIHYMNTFYMLVI